jgi:hypothetical protein
MEPAARIELYVAERAVARHETAFQEWVERVTAPLRYVCVGEEPAIQFCPTPLGTYIKDFEQDPKEGSKPPRRQGMSAFSGFSVARDQRGVWFRKGTGAPDEDRVSIYTFLVDRELGAVAYYAVRERLAKTILRERNEQSVLLTRMVEDFTAERTQTVDQKRGLQIQKEFVGEKDTDYREFAKAFEAAAHCISAERIDLAWKLLHLFQLLQRDLMASARGSTKYSDVRKEIYEPLFKTIRSIIEGVFERRILDRMSTSIFVTWLKIAGELHALGDNTAAPAVRPYIEQALKESILKIADSLWRFQGHGLAGAADLGCDSCGVEAFAFVAALRTCQHKLALDLATLAEEKEDTLQGLWKNKSYIPLLLLRDWRGLSYGLNEDGDKHLKDLAPAFALRTLDSIARSGISDERTWYLSIKDMFRD